VLFYTYLVRVVMAQPLTRMVGKQPYISISVSPVVKCTVKPAQYRLPGTVYCIAIFMVVRDV